MKLTDAELHALLERARKSLPPPECMTFVESRISVKAQDVIALVEELLVRRARLEQLE